jgi:hypothetical protein
MVIFCEMHYVISTCPPLLLLYCSFVSGAELDTVKLSLVLP